MIISASRRTDIPTYYAEWFFNRIKAGYLLVRNPMNPHQVSKIRMTPDVVDGIVFWTKNPAPMLSKLDLLREYAYYFQFTLNAYGTDVETALPTKAASLLPTFGRLADKIGPDRVIWRYDPIFLSKKYSFDYHVRYFEKLAKRLSPYTKKCIISFLDYYRNTERQMADLSVEPFPLQTQEALAKILAEIAGSYGLKVETCAEAIDLAKYGIGHAHCIDGQLLGALLHSPLEVGKDKGQRPTCGCVESIDIGAYNTCQNGCRYCYANYRTRAIDSNRVRHDPRSPLLVGEIGPEDRITERKMVSYLMRQTRFEM